MPTGTVKSFARSPGYGFIVPDGEQQEDVFVHVSAVRAAKLPGLAPGQRLTYTLVNEHGKQSAVHLRLLGE